MQQLTGITNGTIKTFGLSFIDVMDGLVEFLDREQARGETLPIAHGGYSYDFSILLVSCMKYTWDKFGILIVHLRGQYASLDGLDALCEELNMKRSSHSALEDAYILKTVCNKKPEMLDHPYGYTFGDITYHLIGNYRYRYERCTA